MVKTGQNGQREHKRFFKYCCNQLKNEKNQFLGSIQSVSMFSIFLFNFVEFHLTP